MILAPISHVFRWNTNHRFIEKATVLDKLIEIFSTDRANSTDRSTIGKGWAASLVTFRHDSYESIARIVYTYRCRVVESELHSYAGSNGNLVGHRWEEAGGWNEGMNDRDGGQRRDREFDLIEPHRGNGSDGKCSMSWEFIWRKFYNFRESRRRGKHGDNCFLNGELIFYFTFRLRENRLIAQNLIILSIFFIQVINF